MLRTAVPARAVLALTATATSATASAIAETLGIAEDAIIRDDSLRPNLRLAVTHINGGAHCQENNINLASWQYSFSSRTSTIC